MSGLAEIILLRTTDCRQAAAFLPALASAAGDGPDDVARHVAECLRCQAEMAAYRRILRHLRALRYDDVRSPPGALATALAALEAAALEDHASGANRALRVVYVSGITVATAAATTAGVLVWINRRRMGLAETG